MDIGIVKIEGSVELAPLLELSDAIVDIVETGSTLKENGLEVKEDVCTISARMIVNTASMKLRKDEIDSFVEEDSTDYDNLEDLELVEDTDIELNSNVTEDKCATVELAEKDNSEFNTDEDSLEEIVEEYDIENQEVDEEGFSLGIDADVFADDIEVLIKFGDRIAYRIHIVDTKSTTEVKTLYENSSVEEPFLKILYPLA